MSTSGFYLKDGDTLRYAPNAVYARGYTLTREAPVAAVRTNWKFFASEAEARAALGLPTLTAIEAYRVEDPAISDEQVARYERAATRVTREVIDDGDTRVLR
jgi:hypothetical protein